MNEVQETPEPADMPPAAEPVGPGALLREAREARGLAVGDVVQALKFSPRQIEALEADQMMALPGPVFVRGIVRSYARFLKLDPEPLLASLASDVPTLPPDVRPPDNMGTAMPRAGVRQVPVLVAVSILLLVGAATMGAWHFLGPAPIPAAMPTQVVAEPVVPVMPPQPRVDEPVSEPAAVQAEAAPAAPPAQAFPAAPVAAPAAPGARQLIFEFRGLSWVEVKDAAARVILTGQYGAGTREAVAGRPPFQIVVGNAPAVALHYDDRVVDLKPHTRADVARLSLE